MNAKLQLEWDNWNAVAENPLFINGDIDAQIFADVACQNAGISDPVEFISKVYDRWDLMLGY